MIEQPKPSTFKRIIKFVGMVMGLGIMGVVFGFLVALIGAVMLSGEIFGFGALVGAIGGMLLGYPIGVLVGIVVINWLFHYRGSILFGILGGFLGGVVTLGLGEVVGLDPSLMFALFFLAVPVMCTVGYRLKKGE